VAIICLLFLFTLFLQSCAAAAAVGRIVFGCTLAQALRRWPIFDLRPVHVGFVVDKIGFFFKFQFSSDSINPINAVSSFI
jgi:hypothetical protein